MPKSLTTFFASLHECRIFASGKASLISFNKSINASLLIPWTYFKWYKRIVKESFEKLLHPGYNTCFPSSTSLTYFFASLLELYPISCVVLPKSCITSLNVSCNNLSTLSRPNETLVLVSSLKSIIGCISSSWKYQLVYPGINPSFTRWSNMICLGYKYRK